MYLGQSCKPKPEQRPLLALSIRPFWTLLDFALHCQNSLSKLPALPGILTAYRCMGQGYCPKPAVQRLELGPVDSSRLRTSAGVPADRRCVSTFFISISAFWGVCETRLRGPPLGIAVLVELTGNNLTSLFPH